MIIKETLEHPKYISTDHATLITINMMFAVNFFGNLIYTLARDLGIRINVDLMLCELVGLTSVLHLCVCLSLLMFTPNLGPHKNLLCFKVFIILCYT